MNLAEKLEDFIALKTLVRREYKRILRTGKQDLVTSLITLSLYFIIFGKAIGNKIGMVNGINYIQFITPGLIMMAIIMNSYMNSLASFFGAKFQKHIEEMLVSPMSKSTMLLGFVAGGVMRGLMIGIIVTIISLFFTHLPIHNFFVTFSIAILTSILFSLAGLINGIYAKTYDSVYILPALVLTPLIYLAGIFYSVNELPNFWRHLSYFNPVFNIIEIFRYGILGTSTINIYLSFSFIILIIISLFFYIQYALNKDIMDY